MNKYAKAIMAALSAIIATVQIRPPSTLNEWLQIVVSGLGVGLVTWYVPNTDNGVVIPPTVTDLPKGNVQ